MAQEVIDKIQRKLASWKGCLLNKVGRLYLVNAVMASIPVYNMQVSLLPKYACDKIDSLMRQFLWKGQANRRGLPLVKWDIAITSKKAGGLGVRDTLCANMALLGKLVWYCLNNKNKLWVQVLTHKYLQNSKDLGSSHCHNASTTWRNILKAYDILKEGFRWNVGNMQQSIWYDEWSPLDKFCELTSYVHISETKFSLADFRSNGTPLEFWIRKVMSGNEAIVGAGLWWVWRHRCNDIFNNGDQLSNYKVVAMARITANDLRKSASTKCITFKDRRRWKPPTGDTFKVNCDASLFSDWNLAGIGCVIRDSNGRWISGCSSSYPPGPIVRCELFAVWRGLILAWDYGLRDIVCETDSLDILHILKNPANGLNCDVVDILQKIQELLSRP
ncbi:uncharacterized protein [Arachis hypogaea]|uniref:uncharacterized protein n=1 Tax=Arachis hypogaea TaxID=3818 RepID=UPI003B2256BA